MSDATLYNCLSMKKMYGFLTYRAFDSFSEFPQIEYFSMKMNRKESFLC